MNINYFWLNTIALAVGTFAIRFSIIAISHRVKFSDRLKEIFTFIPAAILPALIAPMVFFHHGHIDKIWGKERFLILVLATIVCYFTKNLLTTLGFGLGMLYLVSQYL